MPVFSTVKDDIYLDESHFCNAKTAIHTGIVPNLRRDDDDCGDAGDA